MFGPCHCIEMVSGEEKVTMAVIFRRPKGWRDAILNVLWVANLLRAKISLGF